MIGTAATLVLASCGSDGSAGGDGDGGGASGGSDTEAFCEQIRELQAEADTSVDAPAGTAEQFDALIDSAPDEFVDDVRLLVDALAELEELDENDPEAFEQVFEIIARPGFVEASERLEEFGVEECGLDPSPDDGAAFDDESILQDEGAITDAGESGVGDAGVKTTTVPGDPYDEEFWGPIDPDEVSVPGLEQHLDVNYPDEGWFGGSVRGSSLSGSDVIVFAALEDDDGVRLCEAVLEYAAGIDPTASVTIEDSDSSESRATGIVAEGCTAVSGTGS